MEFATKTRLVVCLSLVGTIILIGSVVLFISNTSTPCELLKTKPTLNTVDAQNLTTSDGKIHISFLGYLQYANLSTGNLNDLYLPLRPTQLVEQSADENPKYTVITLVDECATIVSYFVDRKLLYPSYVEVNLKVPNGNITKCVISHDQIAREGIVQHDCNRNEVDNQSLLVSLIGSYTYKWLTKFHQSHHSRDCKLL